LFGHEFVARGTSRASGAASATLRAEDLELAGGGETGLEARVVAASYQGALSLVTVRLENGAAGHGIELRVAHRGPAPAAGSSVRIRVRDAWLLPEAGT